MYRILRIDEGKKDGYIAWVHSYAKDIAKSESTKYGFPITVTPIDDSFYIPSGILTIGTAISRTSKNPESAMKFLELMNTDKGKDLYNLIVYGIEGEHYIKTGENKIQTNYKSGSASSSDNFGLFNFIMGNTFLGYETQTTAEGWNKYVLQENEKAKQSKLVAFKANTSNIKVELAQLSSIGKEFQPSFRMGISTNFEQTWQQYIDKCKGAGLEKARTELQKQVDEFLKTNK